jgi:PLD-like domain
MAKFLDTQAISSELTRLIKDAKEKIILVSPYLKVNPQIQERLKTKSKSMLLSEIVIVYGKSELAKIELEWIKDIEDIKVIEKSNLHAKCYINEERAIICSMNLYDYSQQHNIEMGLLITKEHDKEAYTELMEEINNIKVNGKRKRTDGSDYISEEMKVANTTEKLGKKDADKVNAPNPAPLGVEQKLRFQFLKRWRLYKSKEEKISAFLVLTDEEIRGLISKEKLDNVSIYDILPTKKAIKYGEQIFYALKDASYYTVGTVTNVSYQDNSSSYDKVKLKIFDSGEEAWYDTTQELPNKNILVAVKINKTWFNDYFYLDI